MQYRLAWLALFFAVAVSSAAPSPKPATTQSAAACVVYVSPAGKDDAPGSIKAPVATLERALERVREAPSRPGMPPARIVLRGGTYALSKPIVLTEKDSRLTIERYGDETPIISGGRRVGEWKPATFNGRECWAAQLAEARDGKWFFRELWIDGQRATRARHPDRGYLKVVDSPDAGDNWEVGQTRFRFEGGDIPAGPFSPGAELIVGTRWVESRLPIREVDVEQKLVSCWRRSQWRIEPNDQYWLEGDARWLDQPGEWFLDRASGTVYYLPLPGQKMEQADAMAPVLPHLLEMNGASEEGKFLEDVTLRGITFAHTEWMIPDPDPATTQPVSGGFMQAAIPVPAAVRGKGVRRCAIEQCTFRNMGTWALELGRSTQLSRVVRCTFDDLGGGGIRLGDGGIGQGNHQLTFGNHITDNEIARGGRMFPSAVGVWLGQGFDNVLAHNHIHDFYYSGVSFGWTWGYGDSLNRGNIIEQNHIHHIGQPADGQGAILADMGGIYLLGGRKGTVVRNNLMHDISGVRIAFGIYLDEGCSDVVVENNIVYRASHGGFHLHYGRDNIVRNNTFALGTHLQVYRSREEEHIGFHFDRNIVYWTSGPLTQGGGNRVQFDHNLYGGVEQANFRVGDMTWDQWRAAGQDADSIFADPMFANVEKDDFTLKADSPASKIGFRPIDVSRVGPRN